MITFEKLVDDGLVSASAAELLFGSDERTRRQRLCLPNMLPRTAYNVCLLYSALIQAYAIGSAMQKQCAVTALGLPQRAADAIASCWSADSSYDLAQDGTVFSFLLDWAGAGEPEVTAPEAEQAISTIRDIYLRYAKNTRVIQPLSEPLFLLFLRSLPLLRTTELDISGQRIVIHASAGDVEIRMSPFICFWNPDTDSTVNRQTPNCFVFSSIGKGDRNGEPVFNIVELNSHNVRPRTKRIRRQLAGNESLHMICQAAGMMQTQWYPMDDCWCDLAFLKRIIYITQRVLGIFWKINPNPRKDVDVIVRLRDMFIGSELYDRISTDKPVYFRQLDLYLYEFCINYGVFKSMWGLFLDTTDNMYSGQLFQLYMEQFVEEDMITAEQRQSYESECAAKIEQHLFKLEKIVPKSSRQYLYRSREIKAEWRAFYALQAAGISKENLFADQEEILSIDDYYDMVKNPDADIREDLRSVLGLLTELYGAMGRNSFPLHERQFHRDVWRIRQENEGKDIPELFDSLIGTVEQLNGSAMVSSALGRRTVCDPDNLRGYRDEITAKLEGTAAPAPKPFSERFVFVSYAHEDQQLVSACVEHWTRMGFNVFFDVDKFRAGDDWRDRAINAISSDLCEAVVVFMSRAAAQSEPVSWEMEQAVFSARKKYGSDPERAARYLLAVNLEEQESVSSYLRDLCHTSGPKREYSQIIRKILTPSTIYYDFIDPGSAEQPGPLDCDLRERLFSDDDSGIAVQKTSLSPLELNVINFYAFLKYGDDFPWREEALTDEQFRNFPTGSITRCIFPMVISVKETKIKRDNITLAGYEIISGKGRQDKTISYILSSRRLNTDEYYCIPNYRSAADCSWMVEPFLVNQSIFTDPFTEES